MSEFTPPFMVIAMGLNKDGQGPELDPTLVASQTWEVWDAECQMVSSHTSEQEAWQALYKLNRETGDE